MLKARKGVIFIMYKKFLIFILSCLLFISTQAVVFAADLESLPVSQNYEIVEENDGLATSADIVEALSVLVDDASQISLVPNDDHVTTKVFLYVFAGLRNYCGVIDGRILYPMHDSMWLSEEEWSELVHNFDNNISMETVNKIVQRTLECDEFIKVHSIPDTYDKYKESIDAFYREYSDLLSSNTSAAKYWMKEWNKATIYEPDKFSSLLHEITHEQSAKRSGAFEKRFVTANTWGVYWSKMPNHIWPYNPKTRANTEISIIPIPTTLNLVQTQNIPEIIKKTDWYKVYFTKDSMSNKIGVYGMLEEFCASSVDIRISVIDSTLQYDRRGLYEEVLQRVYFWKGAIGQYLVDLKKSSPSAFERIVNSEFSDLLNDTIKYVDEQIEQVHVISTSDKSIIALRTWSEQPEIQEVLQECFDIALTRSEAC